MAAEDVAGHELRGRHVLQGSVGEDLSCHLRLGQLQQEAVFGHGIHFECVAQTHLPFLDVGQNSELFVDHLGSQNGVRRFDRVVGRQVVIFAGVEDNAAVADDDSGEELVYNGSLHVDVAEQNAVQGVVEHDVQTFQSTGGVVAQTDVSADIFTDSVQSLSHDAEVFLRCIGTAETFGGGAVGNVVQQGLCSRSDNGDDICTLAGCSFCLVDVFVDVAGRNDDVQIRLLSFADRRQVFFSLSRLLADLRKSFFYVRLDGLAGLLHGNGFELHDVQLTQRNCLSDFLGRLARFDDRVAHPVGNALRKTAAVLDRVYKNIGKRSFDVVHAVYAQKSQNGSFGRDGSVRVDELLHAFCDVLSMVSCARDDVLVQIQFACHPYSPSIC